MSYRPIESYGVVGDLHTVALVSREDASVDFLCFPHFDSPSVFAALLDDESGGRFSITPEIPDARRKQLYLPDTNVLLTRFLGSEGVAEVSDFMTIEDGEEGEGAHDLVRRAKTVRGRVRFRLRCAPRFDYARADHTAEAREDGVLFTSRGADGLALRLRTRVPVRLRDGDAVAEFTLGPGETAVFVLEEATAGGSSPFDNLDHASRAFKDTVNYWRRWIGRSEYRGRWQDVVNRSALTLKLLTSAPHGSLVAAPTFGLPEELGGERNWDYRYTWIRDASFTLYALMRLSYTDEAADFMGWLEDRCMRVDPDTDGGPLQIMYGLDGTGRLTEEILDHLEGYGGSAPVRVGNAAYDQLQLDIYGELMDAVNLYDVHGVPIHHDLWEKLVTVTDWVAGNWRRPDEGIWEIRGGRKEFLYSRLMCWLALERALRIARRRSFPGPLQRWRTVRDEIYRDIWENFWHPGKEAFVQHLGGESLDASSLLMPLVGFVSPTDPRWLSHLEGVGRELVSDSLVYRYRPSEAQGFEGLEGEEGTFTICSFWYVECLARAGDVQKARFLFEKALGYANHVGLYAEELGLRGEHLGNFPQAFTHLALIRAACEIDRRLSEEGWRA